MSYPSLLVPDNPFINQPRDISASHHGQETAYLPRSMSNAQEYLLGGHLREPGKQVDGIRGSEQVVEEAPLPPHIQVAQQNGEGKVGNSLPNGPLCHGFCGMCHVHFLSLSLISCLISIYLPVSLGKPS